MKLSEAIRLGAMLRPQTFGQFFSWDGRTCALGAALEATGVTADEMRAFKTITVANDHFPVLSDERIDPITKKSRQVWRIIVYTLSDNERWTRERIADWVATIEPADVPAAEPVEAQEAAC